VQEPSILLLMGGNSNCARLNPMLLHTGSQVYFKEETLNKIGNAKENINATMNYVCVG
jgi:hypothetical protein